MVATSECKAQDIAQDKENKTADISELFAKASVAPAAVFEFFLPPAQTRTMEKHDRHDIDNTLPGFQAVNIGNIGIKRQFFRRSSSCTQVAPLVVMLLPRCLSTAGTRFPCERQDEDTQRHLAELQHAVSSSCVLREMPAGAKCAANGSCRKNRGLATKKELHEAPCQALIPSLICAVSRQPSKCWMTCTTRRMKSPRLSRYATWSWR